MRQQNRLSYLDIAKGLAILLVVLGHISKYGYIYGRYV